MPTKKRDVSKIIEHLKVVRVEKGITYQKIVDETEKMGEPVSMTTVKRVFSDASATEFRWESTLKPIATVVLGIGKEEGFDPTAVKSYYDEIAALRDIVELKNDMIQDLQNKVSHLVAEVDELREQIHIKDRHIEEFVVSSRKRDRVIILLAVLLLACVSLLIGVLL